MQGKHLRNTNIAFNECSPFMSVHAINRKCTLTKPLLIIILASYDSLHTDLCIYHWVVVAEWMRRSTCNTEGMVRALPPVRWTPCKDLEQSGSAQLMFSHMVVCVQLKRTNSNTIYKHCPYSTY